MFIQTEFNLDTCFENLGFKDIPNDKKSIVKKENIEIYYRIEGKLSLHTNSPLDMMIYESKDLVYHGIEPLSEKALIDLLELLFPKRELITRINEFRSKQDEIRFNQEKQYGN